MTTAAPRTAAPRTAAPRAAARAAARSGRVASAAWLIALAQLTAGAGAGCLAPGTGGTPLPRGRAGSIGRPIIGGVADGADPSVVALFAHQPEKAAGDLCTAEVIAPTVLLTAGHCVDVIPTLGANAVFDVLIGSNINDPSLEMPAMPQVVATHFDPAFDLDHPENGHDIGVVVLSGPIGLSALAFNTQPLSPVLLGATVRLVGFGLNDATGQGGAGIKRQVSTRLDDYSATLLHVGDDQEDACSGDSGGPVLASIAGGETIVGVTSYGNAECTGGGYATRIDRYLPFLRMYVPTSTGAGGGAVGGSGTGGCVPSCAGRTCGDDGCGGRCGRCAAGFLCGIAGECLPPSACDQNGGWEAEPDDRPDMANPLCASGHIFGTIGQDGDEDWYTLALPPDADYVVTLSSLTEDCTLDLYKRVDGAIVALGEAANAHDLAPQRIERHSIDGGRYFARVSGQNAASTGARYLLSVELH